MATIQKELIGKMTLVGSADLGGNTYNMILPTLTGTALPNALSNQVIEEVYIICDSSLGDITINLPSIASFNNSWGAKIYVYALAGANAIRVYGYNNEIISDTINGFPFASLVQYQTNYLHIVSDNMWMNLVCQAPRGPFLT